MISDEVIPMPTGKCACGCDAFLRLVAVTESRTGTQCTKPFSDVGSVKVIDKQTQWETARVHGGWRFDGWVEVCTQCFYEPTQQDLAA